MNQEQNQNDNQHQVRAKFVGGRTRIELPESERKRLEGVCKFWKDSAEEKSAEIQSLQEKLADTESELLQLKNDCVKFPDLIQNNFGRLSIAAGLIAIAIAIFVLAFSGQRYQISTGVILDTHTGAVDRFDEAPRIWPGK